MVFMLLNGWNQLLNRDLSTITERFRPDVSAHNVSEAGKTVDSMRSLKCLTMKNKIRGPPIHCHKVIHRVHWGFSLLVILSC
jgi:hypothetical protein